MRLLQYGQSRGQRPASGQRRTQDLKCWQDDQQADNKPAYKYSNEYVKNFGFRWRLSFDRHNRPIDRVPRRQYFPPEQDFAGTPSLPPTSVVLPDAGPQLVSV